MRSTREITATNWYYQLVCLHFERSHSSNFLKFCSHSCCCLELVCVWGIPARNFKSTRLSMSLKNTVTLGTLTGSCGEGREKEEGLSVHLPHLWSPSFILPAYNSEFPDTYSPNCLHRRLYQNLSPPSHFTKREVCTLVPSPPSLSVQEFCVLASPCSYFPSTSPPSTHPAHVCDIFAPGDCQILICARWAR